MKNSARFLALLLVVALGATAVAAADGNPRKGRYLYQKNCRTCHVEGGAGGQMSPATRTQAQWERFFARDQHRKNPDAWNNLSPQDLQDINSYLHDSAADSPKPESCG